MMFVVDILGDGADKEARVFGSLSDAKAFADWAIEVDRARGALIFEVPVQDDPRAAVAALNGGKVRLVAAPHRKATEEEIAAEEQERAARLESGSTRPSIDDEYL
jgi:hypothetical protein